MKQLVLFYLRHKKLFLLLGSLAAVVFILHAPEVAHAQAQAGAKPADPGLTDAMKTINESFNLILRVSAAWLWPIILMIGSLLDNDLIFGGAMGERLQEVWVQIRNLVNIIFVLILLAIAIYNVLGIGEEAGGMQLGFKQVMPKFVLALIAVNFSFLGVKVVLDFTNVMTGAVFALPSTVIEGNAFNQKEIEKLCLNTSKEAPFKALWCQGTQLNEKAKSFFARLDKSNITIAYAIRFGRAPQLKFIKDGIKDLTQLGFNIIFNAILYVVYALSFIALFVVMLVRTIALWVAVALSPVIALTIVLPNLKDLLGGGEQNIQEKFVKNAIAPIKIGLALSIGYIMLDAFEGEKTIHGGILSSSSLSAIDPNMFLTDISDLQQLMIAIASVVIVWVGVFSAAKGTAAESITNFIDENAKGFGKFMARLPLYAQVIPTEGKFGDKKQGNASLAQMIASGKGAIGRFERARGSDLYQPVSEAELNRFRNAKTPQDLLQAIKDLPHLLATENGLNALRDNARLLRIDPQKITDASSAAKAIFSSDSADVQGIAKNLFIDERGLLTEIQTSARSKPLTAPTPTAAVDDLIANTAKAGEGRFIKWSKEDIEAWKKLYETDQSTAKQIVVQEGDVVVRVEALQSVDAQELKTDLAQAAAATDQSKKAEKLAEIITKTKGRPGKFEIREKVVKASTLQEPEKQQILTAIKTI